MNTFTSRIVIGTLAFLLTLISGVLLSNRGTPYNSAIFNVHKLVAVGTVVVIAMTVYRHLGVVDSHALAIALLAVTGLLLLALIASGALLSVIDAGILVLDAPLTRAVLRIHQVAPLLALGGATISIYLLVGGESLSRMGTMK
jgi:hypothetical protein